MHYFSEETKKIYLYDVRKNKEKTHIIDRFIPNSCRTIAINKEKIYMTGGNFDGFLKVTWLFNTLDQKITDKKDMNQQRSNHSITYDDKKQNIYVFGGNDGDNNISHCEKYSVKFDKWTIISPMSNIKKNASVCIFNGKYIFVIGG